MTKRANELDDKSTELSDLKYSEQKHLKKLQPQEFVVQYPKYQYV